MVIFQKIDDSWPVQGAGSRFVVLRNAAGGTGPERNTVRQCRTELMAEIIATQGKGIGQRIVVRDIQAIVIAKRTTTIRCIKAVHFSIIPLLVNGGPVVDDIFGVMQEKMMGLDRATFAIWL